MLVLDPTKVCRLCLVEDQVNIPIFDGEGDLRDIFQKINACLPINVAKEDKLSQKICDECLNNVELFYQFWNKTAHAEKQLLQCLELNNGCEEEEIKGMIKENGLSENDVGKEEEDDESRDYSEVYITGEPSSEVVEEFEATEEDDQTEFVIESVRSEVNEEFVEVPAKEIKVEEGPDIKPGPSGTQARRRHKAPILKTKFPSEPKIIMRQFPLVPKGSKIFILGDPMTTANFAQLLPKDCVKIEVPNLENSSESVVDDCSTSSPPKRRRKPTIPKGAPFQCDSCDLTFQFQREVRAHAKIAHPTTVQIHKCFECDSEFKCKQTLKDHCIRKHTDSYQFICHECGRKFKMKNDLYMHLQGTHRKEEDAICQFCNRVCRNHVALKKHIADMHNVRPYACSFCSRRLATMESLEAHEKLHGRHTEVKCEICQKIFTASDTLKKHMRIHTGVKPYSCKVCGKAFRRQHTYKQHLLLHTDVKPYFCDVCSMTFKQKPSLITHRKRHKGPLPPLPPLSIDYVIKDLLDPKKSDFF